MWNPFRRSVRYFTTSADHPSILSTCLTTGLIYRGDTMLKLHDAKVPRVIPLEPRYPQDPAIFAYYDGCLSATNISVTIFVVRDEANLRNVTRYRTPRTFLTVPMLRRGNAFLSAPETPIGIPFGSHLHCGRPTVSPRPFSRLSVVCMIVRIHSVTHSMTRSQIIKYFQP